MKRILATSTLLKLLIVFIYTSFTTIKAQDNINYKSILVEAESFFIYEEYKDALPLYLKINKLDPENDNVSYKIGICYLNDPFNKEKAIPYLQKAAANMKSEYREKSVKERQAPPEAVYFLAKAYLANDQPDKAIWYFQQFLDNLDETVYDKDLVLHEIASCKRATEARLNKVYYAASAPEADINSRFSETNPVISGNGQSMAFTRKLQFYDAIFYTYKKNGRWTNPENIIPDLKIDGEVYPVSLSYDGTELYLYRSDEYNGNLYVSKLKGTAWSLPVKLNANINTPYWEAHASLSRDGNTMYFSSNRPGGLGELDIYVSHRTDGDNWSPAENLGSKINSRYNDDTPFLTEDGSLLFFSSLGHTTYGGYDIFFAENDQRGSFRTPQNLGYPINTSDNELFFQPHNLGRSGYFSMVRPEGKGRYDIYFLDIYYAKHPRTFEITGFLGKNPAALKDIRVNVKNKTNNSSFAITNPSIEDGKLNMQLEQGNYELTLSGPGIQSETVLLNLPMDKKTSEATFNVDLKEKSSAPQATGHLTTTAPAEKLVSILSLPYRSLTVNSLETISIPINAETGAKVVVTETYPDGTTQTKQFDAGKKPIAYTFTPKAGVNKLSITATNKKGASQTENLTITALVPEPVALTAKNVAVPAEVARLIAALMALSDANLDSAFTHALADSNITDANTLRRYITDSTGWAIDKQQYDPVYVAYLQNRANQYIVNDLVQAANATTGAAIVTTDATLGLKANLPPDATWQYLAQLVAAKLAAENNRSDKYTAMLKNILSPENFALVSVSSEAFSNFESQSFVEKAAAQLGDDKKEAYNRMVTILEGLYAADIALQLSNTGDSDIIQSLNLLLPELTDITIRSLIEKLYQDFTVNNRKTDNLTKAIENLKPPVYPVKAPGNKGFGVPVIAGGALGLVLLLLIIIFILRKRKNDSE